MIFDFAENSDIPALKGIWKKVFGDTDAYIDRYFSELFQKIQIAVLRSAQNKPVSMLSMIPVCLSTGKQKLPGHYIYAAATLPEYEGQGIMTGLLEFCCKRAAVAGDAFSCLVPASDSLFRFYEKRGYRTLFYRDWYHVPPYRAAKPGKNVFFEKLSSADFSQCRRRFVENMGAVLLQPDWLYPYLYQELLAGKAEILSVTADRRCDYLVCYPEAEILVVKETSIPAADIEHYISPLKAYFHCESVIAMFPAENGSRKPYGMLRPLGAVPVQTEKSPYMGLMMD